MYVIWKNMWSLALYDLNMKVSTQSCPTLCDPVTVACQAPLSMEFSRQKYWLGSHSLLQGIFLTQGSHPGLLHCKEILYHLSHQGRPKYFQADILMLCSYLLWIQHPKCFWELFWRVGKSVLGTSPVGR